MGIFSMLVKTTIETVKLPVAVLKDFGNLAAGDKTHDVVDKLEDIKDAAEDK